MDILKEIKNLRIDKDITKSQMGDYLNMSYQNYSKIEDGKTALKLDTFLEICTKLEINPMTLLSQNDESYVLLSKEDLSKLTKAEEVIEKIKKQSKQALQEITIENNPNSQINIGGSGNNNLKF
jgi:DNA-binding Xre family transcriptional regulator